MRFRVVGALLSRTTGTVGVWRRRSALEPMARRTVPANCGLGTLAPELPESGR